VLIPEIADRPGLVEALSLLRHNHREDIVRLCRYILDTRPQAVHIWQDLFTAAIACLICGVPRFFIHRGSLSPAFWECNEYQWHTHFRIMQRIYRYLVRRPDFRLVNNSEAGRKTDADWTGAEVDEHFAVVYNAVEFDGLGQATGANHELRDSLGIDRGVPVIGGSFRMESVKRPMMWIEAARQIAKQIPEAHFVIIGGGEMTKRV